MAKVKIPIEIVSEMNCSDHWRVKHKRHKIQKLIVQSYLRTVQIPPVPAIITLTRYAPRLYDEDNIGPAFKYVRDAVSEYILGIVDNKIYRPGRADADQRLKWVYSQEKTTMEEYYITIQVETALPKIVQEI
jgi:hypothetical protein